MCPVAVAKAAKKIGRWFKQNWRQVVVVAIVVACVAPYLGAALFSIPVGAVGSATAAGVGSAVVSGAVGGAVGGAVIGGASAAIYGGGTREILRGALFGAVSGAVTAGIGHGLPWDRVAGAVGNFGAAVGKAALHGFAQGGLSEIQGGDFASGFVGGAFGSLAGSAMGYAGDRGYFGGLLKDRGAGGIVLSTSIAATVGGTAAALGGGSFTNGAISVAFVHLFNDELRVRFETTSKPLVDEYHNDPSGEVSGWRLIWNNSKDVAVAEYTVNSGGYEMADSKVPGELTKIMSGTY